MTAGVGADQRLAILSYHKVGEPAEGGWHTWYYVSQSSFYEQLYSLAAQGWSFIDKDALLTGIAAPRTLPAKAALVTFDDAYSSLLTYALPVMQEMECPGIVFVPTDYVGWFNAFDYGVSREPREEICSWDDLAELERAGISVQSHGKSHRAFSELEPEELERELVDSRAALEQELGTAVDVLAFPYGDEGSDPDRTAAALRAAGYSAACLYGGGPVSLDTVAPYRLSRTAVGMSTDLAPELGLTPAVRSGNPRSPWMSPG